MTSFQAPILSGLTSVAKAVVPDVTLGGGGLLMGVTKFPSLRDVLLELIKKAAATENRRTALSILWVISVVVLSLFSGLVIWLLHFFAGGLSIGIVVAVIAWSFFFGVCTLFFLPQKFITTIFGTLLGAGASDLSTGAGLITKAHESVKGIADQIATIFKDFQGANPSLVAWCVWGFVVVYLVVCLPAFFREK